MSIRIGQVAFWASLSVAMAMLLLFVLVPSVFAADVNAASCSNGDIQTAVNAAANGDRVIVPSCAAGSWTGSVTIPNTKGITLMGQGSTNTIISVGSTNQLVVTTSSSNQPFRLTGFTFKHTHSAGTAFMQILGTATDWRVDNNVFDSQNTAGGVYSIRVGDTGANTEAYTYGVIDHNEFKNRDFDTSIFVEWPRGVLDPIASGDWIWGEAAQRGTAQAVYIEDNTFSGSTPNSASQVIDCRWGCKYVLRYNTIHNPWISTHSGCTNFGRNPVWQEIYKNTFTDDASRYGGNQIEMRSTSGIVFNNDFAAAANKYVVGVDHERSYRTDCSGTYNARCDGTRSFDENTAGQSGWR